MHRRLLILVPLVVVALAGTAVAGTWYWAKTTFEESWAAWLDERRTEGYRFENVEPDVDGFPERVVARLDAPRIIAPQGWDWQAPAVRGEARVWKPLTVRFQAPGEHLITLPLGERLVADAGDLRGRVNLAPRGDPHAGRISVNDLRLDGLPVGELTAEALELSLTPRPAPRGGREILDVSGSARGIVLPAELETPFGRRVNAVELEASAIGALPREPDEDALHTWRENGGVIEVERLYLDWPPLELTGDGQLGLDEALRPQGTIMVEAQGLEAALDQLAAAGVVDARAAGYIKLALAALGERDDAAGRRALRLPLSFHEGRLYLGPVPLLRLSPVLADRTNRLDALR